MKNETRIPSISAPPGKVAFESHESLLTLWYICSSFCFGFSTIIFCMRSYARVFIGRTWVWEDWTACLVYMMLILFLGSNAGFFAHKGSHHMWNLTHDEAASALFWFNNSTITYSVSVCFTKLAISNLYRRIFNLQIGSPSDVILRLFRWAVIVFYFVQTIAKLFGCTPMARTWDRRISGHCIDKAAILNSSGLFNCITDMFLLLIPVRFVWKLQLSRMKKIRVILTFTFGAMAPIFSITGTVTRILVSTKDDMTHNFGYIILCASAEATIGVILLSLPTVPIIFRRREPKISVQSPATSRENWHSNHSEQATGRQQRLSRTLEFNLSDEESLAPRGDDIELQDMGGASGGNRARTGSVAATVGSDSMEITRVE